VFGTVGGDPETDLLQRFQPSRGIPELDRLHGMRNNAEPATAAYETAYCLLRLTLGVNILMHGASRIASGLPHFVAGLMKEFAASPLPAPLVHAFAYTLPWSELFIGAAILFGLWTRPALVLGALEIFVLTFGEGLLQKWSVAGIQLLYAVVYAILLAFVGYNRWSIDGWRRPHLASASPYRETVE